MKNVIPYLSLFAVLSIVIQLDVYAQSITNVSPNTSYRDTTLDVIISGNSTSFGQGTSVLNQSVWFSQATHTGGYIIYPNHVTATSTTSMIANFSIAMFAPVGYYNVNVVNAFDGSLMLANGYKLEYNFIDNVPDFDKKYGLKVFPVPTSSNLTIEMNFEKSVDLTIEFYDGNGRLVFSKINNEVSPGSFREDIDLKSLNIQAGSYIIKFQVGTDVLSKGLIIQ